MNHTQGEWVMDEAGDVCAGDTALAIVAVGNRDSEEERANAARIMACVNAMTGIEDPVALVAAVRELAATPVVDFSAQRSKLAEIRAILTAGGKHMDWKYQCDGGAEKMSQETKGNSLDPLFFKKVRGSFASYVDRKGERICDLEELSKQLVNWGDTPRSIGDVKAMELALLAEGYLRASKRGKK